MRNLVEKTSVRNMGEKTSVRNLGEKTSVGNVSEKLLWKIPWKRGPGDLRLCLLVLQNLANPKFFPTIFFFRVMKEQYSKFVRFRPHPLSNTPADTESAESRTWNPENGIPNTES